ncbi:MAG: multiheme c-type cytochrome, partial [Planctomycetota bacterium]
MGTNYLNGTINSTSYWCSNCHTDDNTNRTGIVNAFGNASFDVPVENTNASDVRSGYWDHTTEIAGNFSDLKCFECHGELLSNGIDSGMDAFIHNVAMAGGNPNCLTSCHGVGTGPQINMTSFNNGSHFGLNNFSADPNAACWACHSNGSATGDAAGADGMGLNKTTPWLCPDCHTPGGPNFAKYAAAPSINAHVPSNVTFGNNNLTTNGSFAYCTNCHVNSIGNTNVTGAPGSSGRSLLANVSHYLTNTSLRVDGNTTFINGTGGQATNCTYCHYDDVARPIWGQAIDPRLTKNHRPEWTSGDCGSCHFQSLAGSLHDPTLTGTPVGGPDCVFCHDVGGASPGAPKVNVSAMNQTYALHRMLNNRSGQPGVADTTYNGSNDSRRCWACHAAGNSTASFGNGSGNHPANYNQPFNCTNCHINGSSGNDVYVAFSFVKNVTNHWDGNATNESRGQDTRQTIFVTPPFAFNDSECIACHNNSLGTTFDPDANDTAASNVSHYGINASGTPVIGPGLVQNTAQNCTYCHVQPNGTIRELWLTNNSDMGVILGNIRHETNVSHCDNCHGNLSSSIVFHSGNLSKEISVHYAFDWEGDDNVDFAGSADFEPDNNKDESCPACHNAMSFEPISEYKICESCHLPNGTGPFPGPKPDGGLPPEQYTLRSDLSGWNISDREALGIPIIYAHVPYNSIQNATPPAGQSRGVQVKRNLSGESGEVGMSTASSCFSWNPDTNNGTCHGVSYAARFNATPPEDQAAGKEFFMHYKENDPTYDGVAANYFNFTYMNTYIQDFAPNTTDCLWCHNRTENASVRRYWGNAILIYNNRSNQSQFIGPELMFGATNNSDCYSCHTTDGAVPNTFHVSTLQPSVSANCLECHDQAGPQPGVTHDINVSVFNNSVHRNLNENATISNASWNPIVKACWGCHNEDGLEGGMELPRYNNPYICTDCHINTAYANVSDAPKVSTHFTNSTTIKASYNTTVVRSCKNCHNLQEMINANDDTETSTFDADGDGLNGTDRNFYHYGKNSSTLQSQYDVTRNSSDCGGPANTNCSGWNSFPANLNYTYTNCSICHQAAGNNFTIAMNRSDLHADMLNHTDNAKGPFCTDCHIQYDGNTTIRIHDPQLVKPFRSYVAGSDGTGMYNSTLCESCHEQKEVHADDATINSDSLECASCHANASGYVAAGETVFGDKQVHGIRFVNDSGVYSAAWDRTAASNCTTCHMGTLISQLNASPSAGLVAIPKVPTPTGVFNHSDNSFAGTLWNQSTSGFFGPWKPANNNLRACLYCHGNVNNASTNISDITDIVHNLTALGRASNARVGSNFVNGTINSTSYWCSNCHTDLNDNRSAIVTAFTADGFEAPVENTNSSRSGEIASDGVTQYFDHTTPLASDYSDSKCFECHGGLVSGAGKMDEFLHNVQTGQGSPDCVSCHDIGGDGLGDINVSLQSRADYVHNQLNNRTGDAGTLDTGGFDSRNYKCWACHSNGSAPPSGIN